MISNSTKSMNKSLLPGLSETKREAVTGLTKNSFFLNNLKFSLSDDRWFEKVTFERCLKVAKHCLGSQNVPFH